MFRVLVVADDQIVQYLVAHMLGRAGHRVVAVANRGAAFTVLSRDRYFDAVLCDMRQPHLNGLRFLEELRVNCPHIPVIVSSVYTHPDMVREAVQRGVCSFLPKPFSQQQLLDSVHYAAAARVG